MLIRPLINWFYGKPLISKNVSENITNVVNSATNFSRYLLYALIFYVISKIL